MLVESKANVNIIDKDNATPLSYACGVLTKYIPDGHFRLYAVVATLLFYGADVNVARLSSRHPSKKKKRICVYFFFPNNNRWMDPFALCCFPRPDPSRGPAHGCPRKYDREK